MTPPAGHAAQRISRFVDAEKFLDCVHCGLCLTACPTYLELGTEMDSPRGRIHLMRDLERGTIDLTRDVVRHLDLCLGCRACETACPSGVHYGELIEAARSHIEAHHRRGLRDWLRRRFIAVIFPYPRRLRLLLLPLRALERLGWLAALRRRSAMVAMLPSLSPPRAAPELRAAHPVNARRVGLLSGCMAQVLFAPVNDATVRVLRRCGFGVEVPPGQVCCGALHLHNGERHKAAQRARQNIDAFGDHLDAIIANAAGCGAMLKEYGELLRDDPEYAERAAQFSRRARDISEILVGHLPATPAAARSQRVTYHDACHLAHAQGVRAAPRDLLRAIPGVELIELPEADLCCGSAGSYNVTEPEMARRLGDRKAANIRATGATCVAVGNPGCAMQIAAALRRIGADVEVRHPVELIDRSYGDDT